jgi:hypothetical protein
MPDPNSVPLFRCKSCFALYQVVKTQAGPETVDPQIACRVCKGPLAAREGQFVLKYFLLREASRLDTTAGPARFSAGKTHCAAQETRPTSKRHRQMCRGQVPENAGHRDAAAILVAYRHGLRATGQMVCSLSCAFLVSIADRDLTPADGY